MYNLNITIWNNNDEDRQNSAASDAAKAEIKPKITAEGCNTSPPDY